MSYIINTSNISFICSQADSAAAHPQEHHESEAPHRAGDGEAGHRGLGGRGVRPHLRPPQPRPRTEGHHAGVNGVCAGVTPVVVLVPCKTTDDSAALSEQSQTLHSMNPINLCCRSLCGHLLPLLTIFLSQNLKAL